MGQAVVSDVLKWLDEIAPFETAEEFDNVGLLVGNINQQVQNVLVALDLTAEVIKEAKEQDIQLIITHHPVMFHPIQRILEDTYEGRLLSALIREGISLIAAHTNIDKTLYSGSASLARNLQLLEIKQEDDYLFIGTLPKAMRAQELEVLLEDKLNAKVIRYGRAQTLIERLAIAGGAYDEGWLMAAQAGAQALLTGEVKHHNAIAAAESGVVLFEGGHLQTEQPMVPYLAECLQKALNDLQYNVRVYTSEARAY